MDWEELFARHILKRGRDYFLAGKVSVVSEDDSRIIARVVGSDKYDVGVDFDEMGDVIEMECDCPHALSGHYCKHMAAVLYQYYEEQESDDLDLDNDSTVLLEDSDALVDQIDHSLLRGFVNELIRQDASLKSRLLNYVHTIAAKRSLDSYQIEYLNIIDSHSDYDGFVDYDDASYLAAEANSFIENNIGMLLEINEYQRSYEIIAMVISETSQLEIDDSGGEMYFLFEKCFSYLDIILVTGDLKLKRDIFDWVKASIDQDTSYLSDDFFEELLMKSFEDLEFEDDRLDYVKNKLGQFARYEQEGGSGVEYHLDKWSVRYLKLLDQSRVKWDLIEEVCRTYWQLVPVRQFCVDKFIEKNDFAKAIEILHESQEIDQDSRHLVASYSVQLKDLYRKSGDKTNYISQLWQLALNDKPGNLELYQELKSQYDHQEWTRLRDRILLGLPRHINIAPLLNEDKLYGRLMGYVYERPGLSLVFEYEQVLKPEYSRQILNKYALELDDMAQVSSNRGRYREMVALLVKMKKFQGGEDLVNNIVVRWREDYRRRRAMMEELNQVFK